jgi:7-cyano-7-deazaguanine synthase in queuosine biosynthesis
MQMGTPKEGANRRGKMKKHEWKKLTVYMDINIPQTAQISCYPLKVFQSQLLCIHCASCVFPIMGYSTYNLQEF